MKTITIKTIKHGRQRYDTCGDYFNNGKEMLFHISEMKNDDYEFLIALHELVEWYLCKKHGVSIRKIDEFDKQFELARRPEDESEPGDDPTAPYYLEHQFATIIEKQMAEKLNISWKEYNKAVLSLS